MLQVTCAVSERANHYHHNESIIHMAMCNCVLASAFIFRQGKVDSLFLISACPSENMPP